MVAVSAARNLFNMVALFLFTYLFRRSTDMPEPEVAVYQPPIDLVQWAKEWVAQHHGVPMEVVESTYPLTTADRLMFWEDAREYFEIDGCGFEDINAGRLQRDVESLRKILWAKGKRVGPICRW